MFSSTSFKRIFSAHLIVASIFLSSISISHAFINEQSTLIKGARIFDGVSENLSSAKDVLIVGDKIAKIGSNISAPEGAKIIEAEGRVLSPGFIDAHAHMMLNMSFMEGLTSDEYYWAYRATNAAEIYLSRGFTTVRDMSGNSFSLKKVIDQGYIPGPRIYPSGPMISQTSGHSDHRFDSHSPAYIKNEPSVFMKYNMVSVADGRPQVLVAVRENLRRGASQIKISVGGGVGSFADPLYVTQYTPDEIKAAVEAAADWDTYVSAHVYNDKGVIRAIDAGVKVIEHGNLISRETIQYMKDHDVWLSPQVKVFQAKLLGLTKDQEKKQKQALDQLNNMFTLIKEVGYDNVIFGTDFITDPGLLKAINDEFILRQQWFTPFEIMRQATSKAGELLALSGQRNPYPAPLGVIKEGAWADILLINGNPLQDLTVLSDPDKAFALIMKGGEIHTNRISGE